MTHAETTVPPRSGGCRSSVFGIVLVLFAVSIVVEFLAPGLRHLKYVVPPVALLLALPTLSQRPRGETSRYFDVLFVITVCVFVPSLTGVLFEQRMTMRFLVELYLVCTPLATAALMYTDVEPEDIERHARTLFLWLMMAYVIEHGWTIAQSAITPRDILNRIATSTLESESTLSLTFGLFTVYFTTTKQWKWSTLAFFLTILGFKRIALAGVVFACGTFWLLQKLQIDPFRVRRWLPFVLLAINGIVLLAVYYVITGSAGEWVLDRFDISLDYTLMGRVQVYQLLWEDLGFSWLGHGLGSTTTALELRQMDVVNAHSDVLKYALEIGVLGSGVWTYVFYRLHCRSPRHLATAIYINVLFFTDNVSIYTHVMLPFFVISGALFTGKDTGKTLRA